MRMIMNSIGTGKEGNIYDTDPPTYKLKLYVICMEE